MLILLGATAALLIVLWILNIIYAALEIKRSRRAHVSHPG